MAEAAPAGFDIRRYLLIGGVVAVVAISLIFFLLRGCGPASTAARKPGYTVIYSNLELKDAANVIARLKELTIPYEIRDEGRAIAVPKERTDQARIGLAEKNLPTGGAVGWEIFNEARMGATDFDRRIQLIRAISGELSRVIRRIEGVEDAWVQIVIPETKLFAATVVPVTGSVMLRIRPGVELGYEKISGIVHLVASSVENLQPENVTVIDDTGKIMLPKAPAVALVPAPPPPPAEKVTILSPEVTVLPKVALTQEAAAPAEVSATAEVTATPEVAMTTEVGAGLKIALATPEVAKLATLTAAEKILLKVQAKQDLEHELSGKAQELLNRFYPLNSVIARVTVEIQPAKEMDIKAKALNIKKINSVILLDNRIDLTPDLKQSTYTTVAAAIGYNKKRGDRIILQKVPFHLVAPSPEAVAGVEKEKPSFKLGIPYVPLRGLLWLFGITLSGLLLLWLVMSIIRRSRAEMATVPVAEEEEPRRAAPPLGRERVSMLDQVKAAADSNPERIAELLKSWLSE